MTEAPPHPDRAEQPNPAALLGAIRGNTYRLTLTTRVTEKDGRLPRDRQIFAAPLLTQLRDAIRPDQGRTEGGRGGGKDSLPYDHAASSLLGEIEGGIASMYRSALEVEPIGASEQLLLDWLREFEYSFRAGDVVAAQLTNYLIRIRGWRFAIEDHFTPPRRREFAMCPACGYTDRLVLIDGEIIQQRCVVVTYWPGNERRPPIAECRNCGQTWTGRDGLLALSDDVEANVEEYGDLERGIVAPLPEPTNPDEPTETESAS